MVKIAIADAHRFVHDSIGFICLNSEGKMKHVCSSYKVEDLVTKLRRVKTDVLIIDVDFPLEKGMEACTKIRKAFPALKIIVFSKFDDLYVIQELFRIGINCYLEKTEGFDVLLNALDDVIRSGYHIRYNLSEIMNTKPAPQKKYKKPVFTKRELLVVEFVRQEFTTKAIAEKLGVHIKTVEFHKTKLLYKTGSKKILSAIDFMISNGYIPRHNADVK